MPVTKKNIIFFLSVLFVILLGMQCAFAEGYKVNWQFQDWTLDKPVFEDTLAYLPTSKGIYVLDTDLVTVKVINPNQFARTAAIAPDGTKWFGFSNFTTTPLVKYTDDGSTTVYSPADVGLSNSVKALAVTEDNHIWVGTDNGIGRFDGNGNWDNILHTDTVPNIVSQGQLVQDITIDSGGDLWISTGGGLVYWKPGTKNHQGYGSAQGLLHNVINACKIGTNQNLFLATAGGLTVFNPFTRTVVKNYVPSQLFDTMVSNNRIEDIAVKGLNTVYCPLPEYVMVYDAFSDTFSLLERAPHSRGGADAVAVANDGTVWFSTQGDMTDTNEFFFVSGLYSLIPDSKAWTLVMYYALDNDLDLSNYPAEVIRLTTDTNPAINRIVLIDGSNRAAGKIPFNYTARFELGNNKQFSQQLGELNSAAGTVLSDFILWAVKNYPAEHYALVLDNHGNGIKGDNEVPVTNTPGFPTSGQSIGIDEQVVVKGRWDQLTTREIQNSIKKVSDATGKRLDVVFFNACLMQMIEVAYELRNYTDYIVGGQSTIWTNHKLDYLSRFTNQTTPSQAAFYFYDNYKKNVTNPTAGLSIVRTDQLEPLRIALDSLVSPLNLNASDSTYFSRVINAREKTQMFDLDFGSPNDTRNSSIDIYDFANNLLLEFTGVDNGVTNSAIDVMNKIDAAVIRNSHKSGVAGGKNVSYDTAHGLSIFFPPYTGPEYDTTLAGYTGEYFEFAQNSNWDSFLQNYVRDSSQVAARLTPVQLLGSLIDRYTITESYSPTITGVTYSPLFLQLFYDTDTDGVGGTLIDSTTVYGTETIYNQFTWSPSWNVATVPSGDYYLYAYQTDLVVTGTITTLFPPVYHIDTTLANVPPQLTITNVSIPSPNFLNVSWEDFDPDDNARLSFFLDRDTDKTGGIPIPTDTPVFEDSGTYNYRTGTVNSQEGDITLDISSIPPGKFYLYALLGDGKDTTTASFASPIVRLLGDISGGSGFSENGDGKIDISDFKLILEQFGLRDGDPDWIPETDFNGDGKTDFEDLIGLATSFGFQP